MIGQKLGDFQGKVTGQRVLPSEGQGPRVETSVEFSGPLLGVASTGMATYRVVARPDGTLYGVGDGVTMSKEGDMAQYVGQGIVRFTAGGGTSIRGSFFYQTPSPKWARLNSMAVMFEWDADEHGNAKGAIWEWK